MLAECPNSKGNVRACPEHCVHERAKRTLVLCRVYGGLSELVELEVHLDGSGDQPTGRHAVALEDILDVATLRDGEHAVRAVTANLHPEDPLCGSEVGHLEVGAECCLEHVDRAAAVPDNEHVIDVQCNDKEDAPRTL